MSHDDHLDCTRLSDKQRTELLSLLSRAVSPRAESKRSEVRYEYRVPSVRVSTVQRSSGEAKFVMHARNISRGGISLLHGGFLHVGTPCSIALEAVSGKSHIISGEVVACRLICRNIHEVGILFFEKISIEAFCGPGARVCSELPGAPNTPRLKGLAVCLSKPDAQRRAIVGWLAATGLDAVEATSFGAMMDRLRRLPFVVAVIDAEGADWDAAEAVRSARAAGYSGGIIVVGPKNADAEGADAFFERPVALKDFYSSLATMVIENAGDEAQPIYSTLADAARDRSLLVGFLEHAHEAVAIIERARSKDDPKPIVHSLVSLKSTAGGYGFGALGQAAAVALTALERGNLKLAERPIGLVVSLCRRLSADTPPAKAA